MVPQQSEERFGLSLSHHTNSKEKSRASLVADRKDQSTDHQAQDKLNGGLPRTHCTLTRLIRVL